MRTGIVTASGQLQSDGLKSLADPSSDDVPRTHTSDYGVYGVIDQILWRLPGDDPKKGIGAFARAALSPSDRNLLDLYADAGLNFMGLWDKRPGDSFGLRSLQTPLYPCAVTKQPRSKHGTRED